MSRFSFSRRDFVVGAIAGTAAGATIVAALLRKKTNPDTASAGNAVFKTDRASRITTPSFIAIDHARCSGCRVCEAECALVREHSFDLGRSRIKAHRFEPQLDVIALCAGCADAPCVSVCPKEVVALTRDTQTGAVLLNESKCIGCQACIKACAKDRTAVIRLSRDGKKAIGLCDLCGGDPACVKVCPERCLSVVPANVDGKILAANPSEIARSLSQSVYRVGRDR
jgi:Fe-S-cluster-containing hydrogenase component 2